MFKSQISHPSICNLNVAGGHTDSPNLKVKPRSKRHGGSGTVQLAVECYGGGLWHTWFDRDLGLSGRVMVRHAESGRIEQRLLKIDRAIVRIPNLAIHLQTAKEREAFAVNKEDHLQPILAMEVKKALSGNGSGGNGGDDNSSDPNDENSKKAAVEKDGWVEHQETMLLECPELRLYRGAQLA